ncbi:hypothetical protein A2U01_0031446, partial [Trifolium medium]|nr:hypothetical protein [Trifolium medium]
VAAEQMNEHGIYTRACASRQQGRAMRQEQMHTLQARNSTAPCAKTAAHRANNRTSIRFLHHQD